MNERTKPDASQVGSKEESSAPIEILSPDGELTLRQLTPSDAQELFDLIDRNRGYLSQFGEPTSKNYPSVESVLRSITNPISANKLRFGIRDKSGKLMGSISLTMDPFIPDTAELGYYIGEEFSGKGVTTQAAKLITEYAFTVQRTIGVYARVAEGNIPSRRVLEKAGFVLFSQYKISGETELMMGKTNLNRRENSL